MFPFYRPYGAFYQPPPPPSFVPPFYPPSFFQGYPVQQQTVDQQNSFHFQQQQLYNEHFPPLSTHNQPQTVQNNNFYPQNPTIQQQISQGEQDQSEGASFPSSTRSGTAETNGTVEEDEKENEEQREEVNNNNNLETMAAEEAAGGVQGMGFPQHSHFQISPMFGAAYGGGGGGFVPDFRPIPFIPMVSAAAFLPNNRVPIAGGVQPYVNPFFATRLIRAHLAQQFPQPQQPPPPPHQSTNSSCNITAPAARVDTNGCHRFRPSTVVRPPDVTPRVKKVLSIRNPNEDESTSGSLASPVPSDPALGHSSAQPQQPEAAENSNNDKFHPVAVQALTAAVNANKSKGDQNLSKWQPISIFSSETNDKPMETDEEKNFDPSIKLRTNDPREADGHWVQFGSAIAGKSFGSLRSLKGRKLVAFCEQKMGPRSVLGRRRGRNVCFRTEELANEAVAKLHGLTVDGCIISAIRCDYYEEKEARIRGKRAHPRRRNRHRSAAFPLSLSAPAASRGHGGDYDVYGRVADERRKQLQNSTVSQQQTTNGGASDALKNGQTSNSSSANGEETESGEGGRWVEFGYPRRRKLPTFRCNYTLESFCEKIMGPGSVTRVRGARYVAFRFAWMTDEAIARMNGATIDGEKISVCHWSPRNPPIKFPPRWSSLSSPVDNRDDHQKQQCSEEQQWKDGEGIEKDDDDAGEGRESEIEYSEENLSGDDSEQLDGEEQEGADEETSEESDLEILETSDDDEIDNRLHSHSSPDSLDDDEKEEENCNGNENENTNEDQYSWVVIGWSEKQAFRDSADLCRYFRVHFPEGSVKSAVKGFFQGRVAFATDELANQAASELDGAFVRQVQLKAKRWFPNRRSLSAESVECEGDEAQGKRPKEEETLTPPPTQRMEAKACPRRTEIPYNRYLICFKEDKTERKKKTAAASKSGGSRTGKVAEEDEERNGFAIRSEKKSSMDELLETFLPPPTCGNKGVPSAPKKTLSTDVGTELAEVFSSLASIGCTSSDGDIFDFQTLAAAASRRNSAANSMESRGNSGTAQTPTTMSFWGVRDGQAPKGSSSGHQNRGEYGIPLPGICNNDDPPTAEIIHFGSG